MQLTDGMWQLINIVLPFCAAWIGFMVVYRWMED